MAIAKKCDRCGVLYEISQPNALSEALKNMCDAIHKIITPGVNEKFQDWKNEKFDFCPECSHSLKTWFFKPSMLDDEPGDVVGTLNSDIPEE